MQMYFVIGMFSTLSLNSMLEVVGDHLLSGVLSVCGGVLSSVIVAWLKRCWENRR